jgi:hypothetical protein
MFYRLVAQPLEMSNYHLLITPTGEAYGGGGHQFLELRDGVRLEVAARTPFTLRRAQPARPLSDHGEPARPGDH